MAEYAYPKALTGLQDTQWSNFIHYAIEDGVTSDEAFTPSANGSGMSVSLAAGEAFVQGILTGNDSAASQTIAAAPATGSGLARIDTIVKRLDRSGTPVIKTAVISSSPSASPAPNALTQDAAGIWEWPVCDVRVDAGAVAITADDVTDRRTATGSNVQSWTTSTRPATPSNGKLGLNRTTGVWEWYDGTKWAPLTGPHDINGAQHTGTLSIARGGTGATSAMAALNALGIYVQPTDPGQAAGRVWIKTVA